MTQIKEARRPRGNTAATQGQAANDMHFVCENLDTTQAGAVFPLLRQALPGLTLKAWLRFVRTHARPNKTDQAGVMVIRRAARAHPTGLFVYRREHDLAHGPILVAEHVIAVDVLDEKPVMQALLGELEALARRLDCAAIRTVLLRPEMVLAERLTEAGHAVDGETLWKRLAPDAQ